MLQARWGLRPVIKTLANYYKNKWHITNYKIESFFIIEQSNSKWNLKYNQQIVTSVDNTDSYTQVIYTLVLSPHELLILLS